MLLIRSAMKKMAQRGTMAWGLVTLLAVGACQSSDDGVPRVADAKVAPGDAGAVGAASDARVAIQDASRAPSDASTSADASTGVCKTFADCELVDNACCRCAPAPRAQLTARLRTGEAPVTCDGLCGACVPQVSAPTDPVLRADCIAQQCVVVDLREHEATRCERDSDCVRAHSGFCTPCSNQPESYLALRAGAAHPYPAVVPRGDVACNPCVAPEPLPIPFCAADKHCAMRRAETLDGGVSSTCWSPDQALESASTGAPSCDCNSPGAQACRTRANGERVGLVCSAGWTSVSGLCGAPSP